MISILRLTFVTLGVVSLWTVFNYLTQNKWLTLARSSPKIASGSDVQQVFSAERPNFIFILTDDQDVTLGGLSRMKKTNDYFEKHGLIFENAFTTVPVCCPSRASILTGKYQHNHHVLNNSYSGNCYGERWRREQEGQTFATHLKRSHYNTFFAGKYMNQYGIPADKAVKFVPAGWDHWNGLVGNSVYYNYNLSVNGKAEAHLDAPGDYLTDLISSRAVDFLKAYDPNSLNPFFMMLSTPACHAPFLPSPKYVNAFADVNAPRTPNFNISGGEYKHWLIRQAPPYLSRDVIDKIDKHYGNRWATLLSVDDMIGDLIQILSDKRILDYTYIFFASDNGFHLGQFSLPWDKRQMYDFDIRVPLMMSGPRVPAGLRRREPVVTIDLAPTFLDLAEIEVPKDMDGLSLAPLLKPKPTTSTADDGSAQWRTEFLVEYHGEGIVGAVPGCSQYSQGGVSNCFPDCVCEDSFNNTYSCVRKLSDTENFVFCTFEDEESFKEAYDLTTDPYQMENLAPLMGADKIIRYSKTLRLLKRSSGH